MKSPLLHLCFMVAACAMIPSGSTAAPKDAPIKFSVRAYDCPAMEFAELNSLKKAEMESAYCSAQMRADDAKLDYDTLQTSETREELRVAMQSVHVKQLMSCNALTGRISDLYTRKFNGWPDCSRLKRAAR